MTYTIAKYLNHLLKPPSEPSSDGQDWPKIEILGREKDEAENKKFFQQALDEIKEKVDECYQSR